MYGESRVAVWVVIVAFLFVLCWADCCVGPRKFKANITATDARRVGICAAPDDEDSSLKHRPLRSHTTFLCSWIYAYLFSAFLGPESIQNCRNSRKIDEELVILDTVFDPKT